MPAAATAVRNVPMPSASLIAAMMSSAFVTSAFTKAPPMSPATLTPFSSFRSTTTTLAPRAASWRAAASPRPDAPPVTRDEVPLRSSTGELLGRGVAPILPDRCAQHGGGDERQVAADDGEAEPPDQ